MRTEGLSPAARSRERTRRDSPSSPARITTCSITLHSAASTRRGARSVGRLRPSPAPSPPSPPSPPSAPSFLRLLHGTQACSSSCPCSCSCSSCCSCRSSLACSSSSSLSRMARVMRSASGSAPALSSALRVTAYERASIRTPAICMRWRSEAARAWPGWGSGLRFRPRPRPRLGRRQRRRLTGCPALINASIRLEYWLGLAPSPACGGWCAVRDASWVSGGSSGWWAGQG